MAFFLKARWPRFLLPAVFVCVLALGAASVASAQSQRKSCQAPAQLESSLNSHPSAEAYDALGAYFADKKSFPCAITAFRSSLRIDPDASKTHYYLALMLLESGDVSNAAGELRVSLKLDPQQTDARLALGAALSQLKETDAAIEQFRVVLKEHPDSVTALDWLAKAFNSQKRYAATIFLLQQAPADEILQIDLVIAYSQSGDSDRALAMLSQIVHDDPSSPAAHSGLGMAYTQLHRYEEACAEFKEALRLNSQDDVALVSYLKVLIVMGQFQTALPVSLDYLRDHPDDFQANYLAGVIERELGNYAEAKVRLIKAVGLNPNHYDARYNLGVTSLKLGQLSNARVQLEKALQLEPSSAEAHFQLASVFRGLLLPQAAQRQLALYQRESAEQAKKDVAVTKANQAKEFLHQGDPTKAADLYRQAVQEDPKNSQILYELAIALDQERDLKREQEVLERAIEVQPDSAAAHNQLGFVLAQAGLSGDADREFKTAISLSPYYAEAQNNLGVSYGQQGNEGEAIRLFQQAIDSNPAYGQAYVNLAAALADEARFAEAQAAAETAIQIEPDNREARDLHAMIEEELTRRNNSPQ